MERMSLTYKFLELFGHLIPRYSNFVNVNYLSFPRSLFQPACSALINFLMLRRLFFIGFHRTLMFLRMQVPDSADILTVQRLRVGLWGQGDDSNPTFVTFQMDDCIYPSNIKCKTTHT